MFGIGLPKTGTTSLIKALNMIGLRIGFYYKNYPINIFKVENGKCVLCPNALKNVDALADLPVTFFYKELDKLFPGSKFILTHREIESWIKSCSNNLWTGKFLPGNHRINRLHEEFFGTKTFDEKLFRKAYYRHLDDVRQYFKGRDDLLEFDLSQDNKWEALSEFLDLPAPDEQFPISNKAKSRVIRDIKRKLFS